MLHMLPRAHSAFARYNIEAHDHDHGMEAGAEAEEEASPSHTFPWPYFIVTATCLLLFTVDRGVVSKGLTGEEEEAAAAGPGGHSHDHISAAFERMQREGDKEKNKSSSSNIVNQQDTTPHGAVNNSTGDHVLTTIEEEKEKHRSSAAESGTGLPLTLSPPASSPAPGEDAVAVSFPAPALTGKGSPLSAAAKQLHAHRDAILRAWIFFGAMSLHSIFDGLVTGMGAGHDHGPVHAPGEAANEEEDAHGSMSAVAFAVIFHKIFDGISLGVPVYLASMRPLHANLALVLCALATPLGIIIGLATKEALEGAGSRRSLAEGVVLSVSGGSFLFISILELFPSALRDGRWTKSKLSAFSAGLLVMAVIAGVE
jgi:zinc transporter ZupT